MKFKPWEAKLMLGKIANRPIFGLCMCLSLFVCLSGEHGLR